jgi:hypothetical protein
MFPALGASADRPRPTLVPLSPDQVPSLPPPPGAPPVTPPTDPTIAPYPAPGYARWVLPPPTSDDYLHDLPPVTEGRHRGFFMRLALGPGYYRMWATSAEGTMQLRAAGGGLSLSMGGALSENFVLYGEAALQSTLDPAVDTYAGRAARPGTSVTTAALGAGLGYYLMPAHVYLAASLLVAQARAVDRPTEQLLGKTDLGPGLALSLGKDWWLSPSWTIGVMARMQLARLRDPRHGHRGAMWDALGLSAAFTVAFE